MDDAVTVIDERTWLMWALPGQRPGTFDAAGHRRFAQAHSTTEPAVPVRVVEDPDGDHFGWIATGEHEPTMIHSHLMGLRICMPYGIDAEVQAGRGRVVTLSICALPGDTPG